MDWSVLKLLTALQTPSNTFIKHCTRPAHTTYTFQTFQNRRSVLLNTHELHYTSAPFLEAHQYTSWCFFILFFLESGNRKAVSTWLCSREIKLWQDYLNSFHLNGLGATKVQKSGAETRCFFSETQNGGFHRKKPTPDENKSCEWGSQNQHKTVFRSIWERFHGSKFLRFPIANHPPSQSHSPPQLPPTADHQRSHFLIQSKFLPQWPALQTSPLFMALVRLD